MGKVTKRTVVTRDDQLTELAAGSYSILTGANLIKRRPSHMDEMNEALEILRTWKPSLRQRVEGTARGRWNLMKIWVKKTCTPEKLTKEDKWHIRFRADRKARKRMRKQRTP